MAKPAIPVLLSRLEAKYPDARYELDWTTPLELLVATILAAQCTDERVNRVTKDLFRKYKDAAAYAGADQTALEEDVKPTGFYRQKAGTLKAACRVLVDRFGGQVPRTMDEMITIPGVARKTANVVLNTAFKQPSGVIVDTHVARVSGRMGLSRQDKPEAIEADLMRLVPRDKWITFGPAMVLHGRYTCTARAPACSECLFEDQCEKNLKGEAPAPPKKAAAPAKSKTTPKESSVSTKRTAKKTAAVETAASEPEAHAGQSSLADLIPASWKKALEAETRKPYFADLERFVAAERKAHQVFPPEREVFAALELTPFDNVNVVLLGQDPYHDDDQAHGLCFSVRHGIKTPPSLVNMYKELATDIGFRPPSHGNLVSWAKQGVLLLNAVLTVRAHTPNSHKDQGWESFTDAVIKAVNAGREQVVFVLWGGYAQKKEKLIDTKRHVVLKGAHPSPLSARNGFFGSKPFSSINRSLEQAGRPPIAWQLPA